MSVLVAFAVWMAGLYAAQQVSIDFGHWGNAIVMAGAVSAALWGLYRQWVKPIVRWFQKQGAIHEGIAADITHIRGAVDDHDRRLSRVEHVVFPPLTGGEGGPQEPFYRPPLRAVEKDEE